MRILVIVAHPRQGSFNHAIAKTVCGALRREGHRVIFHDLHAERFPALLPADEMPKGGKVVPLIRRHCRELAAADGIVIVHPNWWGMPPAVLVGWIDRVFRPGVAYAFREGDKGEGVPVRLLRLRAALVLNTANTPAARERKVFGDPLELIWKQCVFGLCTTGRFRRKTYGVIATSSVAERRAWLADARRTVGEYFPRETGQCRCHIS